jgi:hypothetical protein
MHAFLGEADLALIVARKFLCCKQFPMMHRPRGIMQIMQVMQVYAYCHRHPNIREAAIDKLQRRTRRPLARGVSVVYKQMYIIGQDGDSLFIMLERSSNADGQETKRPP